MSINRSLTSIHIVKGAFGVLLGTIDEYASGVTVFDLRDGKTIMDVPVYSPSISPDGRYLVFVRFFPEHFVNESESSNVVAFLDLRRASATAEFYAGRLHGTAVYPNPLDRAYHSVQGDLRWQGSNDISFDDASAGSTFTVNISIHGRSVRVTKRARHSDSRRATALPFVDKYWVDPYR